MNKNPFGLQSLYVTPALPLTADQLRRSTVKNLEYTFSALILLVNLSGVQWAPEAITAMSTWFAMLSGQVTNDPKVLIGDLKSASHHFIAWIRSPQPYSSIDSLRSNLTEAGHNYFHIESIVLYEYLFSGLPVSETITFIRVVYAFLSLHSVIVTVIAPNFDTITKASSYKISPDHTNMVQSSLSSLGITHKAFLREFKARNASFKYLLSTKAGPNGHALLDAQLDAAAVLAHQKTFGSLTAYTEFAGIKHIVNDLCRTIDVRGSAIPLSTAKLGRIHAIEEWGGKTRLVAILDYWTQVALDPLHQTLSHFLRMIPMDGTFDQTAQVLRVQAETARPEAQVSSFDLSAATDRFPISFQEAVLSHLLGATEPAANWKNLLTARSFWSGGESYTYGAGQPMGAKSSFPMFALSHHVAIQIAAKQAGIEGSFTDYAIIGDDMTIWNNAVAAKYQTLMASFDVKINLDKSWLHSAGSLPVGELAKRLFISGVEVSAIPVKLIAKVGNNPLNSVALQENLTSRGFYSDPSLSMQAAMGLVDRETRSRLLVLNALPGEVTGLSRPVGPLSPSMNVENMYDGILTSQTDITEGYLYTAVVEQIKRLDALIRESEAANRAVIDKARIPLYMVNITDLPTPSTKKIASLKAELGEMSPFHPLVTATIAEVERISILLSGLRAGVTSLSAMSKRQLVDAFRNPITDVLTPDSDKADSIPAFTLVTRTMTNVDTLFLDKGGTKLDFSLMLVSLQRHFTVSWLRGKGVFVNSVRTKIEQSTLALANDIGALAASSFISPRRDRSEGATLRKPVKVLGSEK